MIADQHHVQMRRHGQFRFFQIRLEYLDLHVFLGSLLSMGRIGVVTCNAHHVVFRQLTTAPSRSVQVLTDGRF